MKINKNIISFLLLVSLLLSFAGCAKKSLKESLPEKDFLIFAEEIFLNEVQNDTLTLHYSIAYPENYGIPHFEPTFGSFSSQVSNETLLTCENYLAALKAYPYHLLSQKEQLIYDILHERLTDLSALNKIPYLYEGLGPTTGFQVQLPVLLAEYNFYDEDDIKDYIKLLKDTPRYFSEVAEYEKEKSKKGFFMSDSVADKIIDQCKAFIAEPTENMLISCFDDKTADFPQLSKDELLLYQEENRDAVLNHVIPAYQTLIDTLTELKGSGKNENGLAGFKKGKEYYKALVKEQTGSSKDITEMKKMLTSALQSSMSIMSGIYFSDSTIESRYNALAFPFSDPKEIMEYLKTAISSDFPVLENVDYSIKYVHESLQDFISPAMYLIPPADNYNANNIFVNPNPAYDPLQLFPTIAHEGYPGHLYQTVYTRKSSQEFIQGMLTTTGYAEGWGLYAEYYSYYYASLDENLCKFLQADFISKHFLYSLTDIGINYDGWSMEETVAFWKSYGIDENTARNIFEAMVSEPCVYLPYAIGYLEFIELKDKAEATLKSAFDTKEFHGFLMDLGPVPFSILEKHLDLWLKEKSKE